MNAGFLKVYVFFSILTDPILVSGTLFYIDLLNPSLSEMTDY